MLDALQTLADDGLTIDAQNAVLNNIIECAGFENEDDERCVVALLWYRENKGKCEPSDCEHSRDETVRIGGAEYRVLTNDEADAAFNEYLEGLLDDEGIVPGANGPYFNREAWKNDAAMDGRGDLAGYDGDEHEYCASNGEWYYLYRQN